MVGASKILTVSYGTFSCTLEGFDDSFNTMKAIAEYFRDLSSEDRYFGAEPPVPDAEMLTRIAEKEVNRRVEARITDNNVVLRTSEPAALEQKTPANFTPVRKSKPVATTAPVVDRSEAAVDADSIAAKLQRIRAVVAQNKAGTSDRLFDEDEQIGEIAEDINNVPAEEPEITPLVDDPELIVSAVSQEADAEIEEDDQGALSALEAFEQQDFAEEEDEEIVPEFSADVSEPEEDVVSDELMEKDNDAILQSLLVDQSAVDEDISPEVSLDFYEDHIQENPLEELIAEAETAEDTEEELQVEEELFEEEFEEAETEFDDVDLSDDIVDEDAPIEDAIPEEDTAEEVSAPETTAMAAAARARARVIKMKTSDVEDAIAAGTLQPLELEEQDDNEHLPEPASLTHDDSTLSDDEEADLAAELANVEAEERAAVQPSRVRPRRATVDTEGHDQAVERLLEETNTKLEDAEGTRRRKGFAHLKAAVAATVADRKFLGGRSQTKKDDEPYREDLAAAAAPLVKSDAVQKDNQEQAPLMLVSEQRVDAPSPKRGQMAAVGGNVSPSMSNDIEIASPVETGPATYTLANAERILSDSTSFEDFAKELGVEELPDLLEAAAAYVAYVQGRPQFSRPHLMSILAKAEQAESYSREDELRSFGQLLREGRLEKVQRGQFKVSSTTKFRPEQRYGHE